MPERCVCGARPMPVWGGYKCFARCERRNVLVSVYGVPIGYIRPWAGDRASVRGEDSPRNPSPSPSKGKSE